MKSDQGGCGRWLAGLSQVACFLIACLLVSPSFSHVVFQRRTLRQWAQGARVVIVGEVTAPLRVWSAPDGSDHQEYFSVRVAEVLAGEVKAASLDLFAHAEGEPRYRVGDTALLFLDPTAERAEFAGLAKRFPLFTTQGAGHEWTFEAADRTVVDIASAWRAARGAVDYATTVAMLFKQLESSDRRLRVEAVAELAPLVRREEFRADQRSIQRMEALAGSERLEKSTKRALRHLLAGIGSPGERDPAD